MKKILAISLAVIGLILTIGGLATHLWLTQPAGPSVEVAENALASEGIIAFGHINNGKINQVVEAANYNDVETILGDKSTLASQLYLGAPDFKSKLQQVMFSLSINPQSQKAESNLMLHGEFVWQNLQPVLSNHFEITPLNDKMYNLVKKTDVKAEQFSCPDEKSKQEIKQGFLYVSQDWLILTESQDSLELIIERNQNTSVASIDLSEWREYRADKLVSFGLFTPKNLSQSLSGMGRFIAGSTYKKNQQIRSVFSGLDLNYLNPGIHLNGQLNADAQWAEASSNQLNEKIDQAQVSVADYSETLASLINNLSVDAQSSSLIVDINIGKNDIEKIPNVMTEFLGAIFNAGNSKKAEDIVAESINQSPWDFSNNDKLVGLTDYQLDNSSSLPSLIQDAFAIDMQTAKIGEKSGLLELEFQGSVYTGETDGFWSRSKAELNFSIDSVLDNDNQELLRDERCDKTLPQFTQKNNEVANGFSSGNTAAHVNKTIRLKTASQFSNIKSVNGKLNLKAPVEVSSHKLTYKKGESFEHKDVQLKITDTQQQTVSYKVTGDEDKILEVRALNQKGDVLNRSQWSNFSGKVTAKYQGNIAELEVFVSERLFEKSIDFAISHEQLLAANPANQYQINHLPSATYKKQLDVFSNTDLSQVTVESVKNQFYFSKPPIGSHQINPLKLFLTHDYQSSWGFNPKLHITLPLIDSLTFNLQAIEINVEQESPFKTFVETRPSFVINKDNSIGKYKGNKTLSGNEYLFKSTELKLDIKSGDKLESLKGNITYNLPSSITQTKIEFPELNQTIKNADTEITLSKINSNFIPRFIFKVKSDNLVNLVAITDEGKFYPAQHEFKNGLWELQYNLNPKIDSFLLLTSKGVEKVVLPFEIKPDY